MVLSIFVLASAFGPLVVAPLSEVYGRRPVLQLTYLFYMVFNLVCAFSKTSTQLLVFRFLSGLAGSASSIGSGILADCWRPEERGKGLSFYYIFSLLGPAIGPIIGGFVMRYCNWRWIFYSTSLFDVVVQIVGLAVFPETYPPKILEMKARQLRNGTANAEWLAGRDEGNKRSPWTVLPMAMIRPTKLITTQVIIQLLAIYIAYIYGLMYLSLSTFAFVWATVYDEPDDTASLNYISLGLGFSMGTQIMAPANDRVRCSASKLFLAFLHCLCCFFGGREGE
jgi:multidrug resistance protein